VSNGYEKKNFSRRRSKRYIKTLGEREREEGKGGGPGREGEMGRWGREIRMRCRMDHTGHTCLRLAYMFATHQLPTDALSDLLPPQDDDDYIPEW